MKILYISVIVIIIIFVVLYFYKGSSDTEYFKSINKFNFVSNNEINLADDFGDIIRKTDTKNGLEEYVEGFENYINKREHFVSEQEVKLLARTHVPRNVFTYWENKAGRNEPFAHIQLCFDTMKKHYTKYNFVILNPDTIKQYLPNVRTDLNDLLIAQKVDYYRVALLANYGGIWVDADTIVMRNLDEVFDKLDMGYDFVGFGCTGKICYNGYPDPSNGVMGSRKNGILMTCCLNKLDKILDSNNKKHKYFDLGKNVIWKCMDELSPYDYYHFPSEYDGSRDSKGKWVHSPNHLSETHTKLLNEDKALFIFLANYELMNDKENKWFLDLDKEQILGGKWWISELYRRALKRPDV
jgi:hypothetical protein